MDSPTSVALAKAYLNYLRKQVTTRKQWNISDSKFILMRTLKDIFQSFFIV